MKRWILLLVLLASCNGCAFYDDVLYEEPVYTQMQPASNSCGMPAGNVNVSQSIEPPY